VGALSAPDRVIAGIAVIARDRENQKLLPQRCTEEHRGKARDREKTEAEQTM
jgi:hypothetical protein